MKSLITSQRTETSMQEGKADLFTRLIKANETDGKFVLDDKELVSSTPRRSP